MEQVIKQIEIIYSNKGDDLYISKVSSILEIDIVEDVEMVKMLSESIRSTISRLRSEIQSSQSRFKLIKFYNSKRRQIRKLVKYEYVMASMANILVSENHNCFLFKNNVEYT